MVAVLPGMSWAGFIQGSDQIDRMFLKRNDKAAFQRTARVQDVFRNGFMIGYGIGPFGIQV